MPEHLVKGNRAEQIAAKWLEKEADLTILARNWRFKKGELDLIAFTPDHQLVFIEVRSRNSRAKVRGAESLSAQKRKRLRQTVEAYIRRLRDQKIPAWRFDLVEITWKSGGDYELKHFVQVKL